MYYPEYDPIDGVALRTQIEHIAEANGRVLLYLNMRASNMGRPDFQKRFFPWSIKSYDGLTNRQSWGWAISHFPSYEAVAFGNLCPYLQDWQDMFVGEMKKAVQLGADCGLMDQLLVNDMCHDKNHGHESPDSSYGPGALQMVKKTLLAVQDLNPEFELAMEGVRDLYTGDIAIYHSRSDFPACAAPEVFRYTLPWVTGISGGFVDMGDLDKIRETFLNGLILDVEIHTHNRGRLSFDNSVASEIRKVNSLSEAHKQPFVEGQFMDTVGLEIKNGKH